MSVVCPVYPKQQTFQGPVGTSQKCHKRTHALQQSTSLFDQFVGAGKGGDDTASPTALTFSRLSSYFVSAPAPGRSLVLIHRITPATEDSSWNLLNGAGNRSVVAIG
jgi:hypothetical protein